MPTFHPFPFACCVLFVATTTSCSLGMVFAQRSTQAVELTALRSEDQRSFGSDLQKLFYSPDAKTRARAALASGRIGDDRALPPLIRLLRSDPAPAVRATAAFALGQIGSPAAIDPLTASGADPALDVRARSIEALGRIGSDLPKADKRRAKIGELVVDSVKEEAASAKPSELFERLVITAIMRLRPTDAGSALGLLLGSASPQIRADAAEGLARSGAAKDYLTQIRRQLSDDSAGARATAAYAEGKADDEVWFSLLARRATRDVDERVRVNAIRAFGMMKDKAVLPLFEKRIETLVGIAMEPPREGSDYPAQTGELIELATAVGEIAGGTADPLAWKAEWRIGLDLGIVAPEISIAEATIDPQKYVEERGDIDGESLVYPGNAQTLPWRRVSADAQGLQIVADAKPAVSDTVRNEALSQLKAMLSSGSTPVQALPDVISAYAEFKPSDLDKILVPYTAHSDFAVSATAIQLIGVEPASPSRASLLASCLRRDLNANPPDAAVAAIDGLAAQHSQTADKAILTALSSRIYLIRREAALVLKQNGYGDYFKRVFPAETRLSEDDYAAVIGREGKAVLAKVDTGRGSFTLSFLTKDAPLTVDNFIRLAKRGYFDGLTFHRVVPNFVIQGGDPRGDGSGGPGYDIRDEINALPYDEGAVGMALAGKDTGGSQWFVTLSPQLHLDGGYTVFAHVTEGMDVAQTIQRGDRILKVTIVGK